MLAELPGGRQPIATHVVPDDQPRWRERMWEKVRDEVTAGRQAYVVCPRIEATDTDTSAQPPDSEGAAPRRRPAAAAVDVLAELADGELAGLRLGLLHGRLGAEEKDAVMRGFAAGDIDVLVATTVVEVGVDVANATVMVILDADRFGVSQLHQLRGRVGRGEHASTCLLHTAVPAQTPAGERLAAVAATNSGAELARVDLRQRGEGDVLGAAQSGVRGQLRLLRLLDDEEIVTAAREAAQRLVHDDPSLASEPALAAAVAGLLDGAAFLEKG
jgi:ATP-dependent DNA helicase RecG